MIIERIVVENFGVYGSGNSAFVAPPDPERPITLFGGNNGAGKTTLLKALLLALYGKRAPLADRNGRSYDEYLRAAIHDEANPHMGARVEVHFSKVEDGKIRQFHVARRWWVSSKGLEERLVVFDAANNADDAMSESWDDFIEDYLPARIANLFFFDGEQIKTLADPTTAATLLKTAVQSLFGLEIVERLAADLSVLERRKRQAAKSDVDRQQLEAIQQEIRRLEELHDEAALDVASAQGELDERRQKLADAEERYLREGGGLREQHVALKSDRTRLASQLQEAEGELRSMASAALPFAFVVGLLTGAQQQIEGDLVATQAEAQLSILAVRDRALLAFLRRRGTAKVTMEGLRKWLDHDRVGREGQAKAIPLLGASREHLDAIRSLCASLPVLRLEADKLVKRVRHLKDDLDAVDRRLGQVPDDDAVRQLHETLTHARTQLHVAESSLAVAAGKRGKLFADLTTRQQAYGRKLEECASIDDAIDDDRRILHHSGRVRSTLEKFTTAAIARRVGQLEQLICESFTLLIRKPDFVSAVRIDPGSFEVSLLDSKRRVIPMARLSAGESQLLATAMLWGLARASGRVVPTVIDTPLGRLDSSHRRHLVERYFPQAAHQVILLSTDEEITQCHLDHLRPSVGNTYRLEFDPLSRSTSIQQGYLFK